MVVNYEKKGRIAIFTINRPETMNAVNGEVRRKLREAIVDFSNDPELWVGILTGAGEKAFCAGADLRGESSGGPPASTMSVQDIVESWKPLVAAINGYCLGAGLEMALKCDIRVAAEHARLGLPEVTRGFIPRGGGTLRLPRMVPWCYAAEVILTGRHIDAQEAYRMGLVNKVVPLDKLMPTAMEYAELICQAAPLAVRAAKEAMIRSHDMTIEDGRRLVDSFSKHLGETEDYVEGRKAFVERRKPDWKGK